MFDPKPVDQYGDEELFTVFDEVVATAKTIKATIQNPAELGVAIATAYQYPGHGGHRNAEARSSVRPHPEENRRLEG